MLHHQLRMKAGAGADFETGLVNNWTLDGNGTDVIGGVNLSVFSTVTVTGIVGNALSVDHICDGIVDATSNRFFNSPFSSGEWTFAAWYKIPSANNGHIFSNGGDSTFGGVNIGKSGTGVYFQWNSGSGITGYSTTINIGDDVWTHVAFTCGSGVVKGYINGTYVSQTTSKAYTNLESNIQSRIAILGGRRMYYAACIAVIGSADDVRLYNRPLKPADVEALAAYTG